MLSESFDVGSSFGESSSTRFGAGAGVAMTIPWRHAFLWNFGVGYDFLGDDKDEGLPSINAFSLQAGMSVFLGGR